MPEEGYPVQWTGRCAVITLPSEVDTSNGDQIRSDLLTAIDQGAAPLIVDLSATTFCDSAGVKAIVSAYRRAVTKGTNIRLVIASPTVRRVFALTEADRLVSVYTTLAEASKDLADLGGRSRNGDGAAG
ncbi:MAG: STAS domain-containing protein [Actinobacteria bacterium]|nr:STAS domain-containing protein [Actinomycetota bacterium]